MKKVVVVVAGILMTVTLVLAAPQSAEARRGGRFIAGLAFGLAGAAILSHHYRDRYYYGDPYYGRRYYGYYPSYYGYYDYYPRRHWRRHHHHHYGYYGRRYRNW